MPKVLSQSPLSTSSKLVKIGEAAKLMGVSIDTIRRWEKKGWIETIKTPGGTRFVDANLIKKINPTQSSGRKYGVPAHLRIEEKETTDYRLPTTEAAKEVPNQYISQTNPVSQNLISDLLEKDIPEETKTIIDEEYKYTSLLQGVNKQLASTVAIAVLAVATIFSLLITTGIITSYLFKTQQTASFFNNSGSPLASLLSPFNNFAISSLNTFAPGKVSQLGLVKPVSVSSSLITLNSKLSKGSVLAESTPSGRFLEINLDTKVNGGLTASSLHIANSAKIDGPLTLNNVTYTAPSAQGGANTFLQDDGTGKLAWAAVALPGDATTTTKGVASFSNNFFGVTAGAVSIKNDGITTTQIKDGTVANADLTNSKITIATSGLLSGGADVALGGSIDLTVDTIDLSSDVTGVLPVANGGTGTGTTPTAGGVAYGTGTALAYSVAGSAGQCLVSGGGSTPTWGSCGTSFGGITLAGSSGVNQTISDGDTITIAAGNGVSTTGGATDKVTIGLNLSSAGAAASATSSNGSGLEANAAGLSLIRGCSNGQLLKWNNSSGTWDCASDLGGSSTAVVDVREGGSTVGTNTTILNFTAADFAVSEFPSGQDNIAIDYANSKIVRSDQNETITGAWTLSSASNAITAGTLTINGDAFTDLTGDGLGISTGALVNTDKGSSQNIFKTIAVPTQTSITANSNSSTLNVAAGTGVTLATDNTTKTLTISATGTGGDITAVGDVTSGDAFTSGGSGNSLYFNNNSNVGQLTATTLTGTRTYTLPDLDGTFTLLGNSTTGSGSIVRATTPTLVTPILGVATATSINKVAITAPASSATLTIADGKTLTANGSTTLADNSITFGGGEVFTLTASNALTLTTTGSTNVTLPTSGTLYGTATGSITSNQLLTSLTDETGTGVAVFATSPTLVTPVLGVATATSINGLTISSTTGTLTLTNAKTLAVQNSLTFAGTDGDTWTFPAATGASGTVVGRVETQTLTNKTLTSPKIGTSILDTNGNIYFALSPTGSANNYLTYANAADGSNPTWTVTGGSDSNIGLNTALKGTGSAIFSSTTANTDSIAIKPQTSGTGAGFTATLTSADLTVGNQSFILPNLAASTSDTLCLQTLANCTGAGGGSGVTYTSQTTNALTKFTSSSGQITSSNITDDGTTVTVAANANLSLADGTGTVTQTFSPLGTTATANGLTITPKFTLNAADQTLSALYINPNTNSNNDSGDTLYGVNIDNISGSSASEAALRLGSGYDKAILFEKGANDVYLNASSQTTGTFTLSIPDLTADADICVSSGNCAGSGSGVTQSGSNANTQIAYFTSSNNLTSASTFTISPTATTGNTLALSNSGLTTGTLTNFTSTNDSAANSAWAANLITANNTQSTTAVSTGSIYGLDLQFNQNTSVSGNTESAARIAVKQNNSASTDQTVSSILTLENNDTVTGNQITASKGLNINGTNVTDGLYLNGTFGTNLINSSTGNFVVAQSGNITGGTYNGLTVTATSGTLTVASGKTLTVNGSTTLADNAITFGGGEVLTLTASNALTLTTTGATNVTLPTSGTLYGTATGSITSNQLLTSLTDETGTGVAVFGTSPSFTTSVTTGSSSFDVFNTTATTINAFGAATTLNIGPTGSGASTIALSGGSADTGCTLAGATGNFTCSGNITGSSTGTVGYWSRSGTTLSPATANDVLSVSGNSGDLLTLASSATGSANKALNVSQTGATSGTDYGGYFSNTGAATTNVGLYATATGATNNYAAIFEAGNVGIGTTAPTTALHVLTADSSNSSNTNILTLGHTSSGTPDSATALLLHADGVNNATTFTDSSTSSHTMTANGNAKLATGTKKFGTASGAFDGTGDYLITADSADWDFGSGDFTIDTQIYFTSAPATGFGTAVFAQDDGLATFAPVAFTIGANMHILVFASASGSSWDVLNAQDFGDATSALSTGSFHHLALVRSGNSWKVFIDGTQFGSTATASGTLFNSTRTVNIGGQYQSLAAGGGLNGFLDEFRVTKGTARWTSNFTAPTAAYGVGGGAGIASGILFQNANTSNGAVSTGGIQSVVTTATDSNEVADLTFSTVNNSGSQVDPTERLRITGAGNVGIGDTSPDAKLEVLGTTEQLRLTYTDGSVDSRFTVDASGNLTIDNTGTKTTIADDLQVTGNDILDSGGSSALTFDGSTNTTANGNLTVAGAKNFVAGQTTGKIGFGGAVSGGDTLNLYTADSTQDWSKVIAITQANNAAEDSTVIDVANTVNPGTLTTGTRTIKDTNFALTPTATITASSTPTFLAYSNNSTLDISNVTLGSVSSTNYYTFNSGAAYNYASGTPVLNDTGAGTGAGNNFNTYGSYNEVGITPTLSSVASSTIMRTYGGAFVNSSASAGNSQLNNTAIGVYGLTYGDLTTTGATTHYGGYFDSEGSADTNYGIYTTASGASTNYALYAASGSVNIQGLTASRAVFTDSNKNLVSTGASADLLGSLSDETGTGVAVFATSPTLVTPVLGVATATSINKVAITAPASSATLTIADGKTLTANGSTTLADNSITFGGGEVFTLTASNALTLTTTGSTNVTLPTSGTLYGTATGSITSNQLLTSLTDETGTGVAVFGTSPTLTTSLITGSSSFDLLNTTATTINFGGAATTLNVGPTGSGASSIVLSGGSSDTGCTVNGANGNLTCSGSIISGSTTLANYWSKASTTLSPATANDIVSIANTTTTGADLAITNTGVYTGTGIFNLTANSATSGTLANISGTGVTTGRALSITGPSSTGVISGSTAGFVNIASDVGSAGTEGSLLYLAPDFSAGSATSGSGIKIAGTDSTAIGNTDYGVRSTLTLTGNAAKAGYGVNSTITSNSTTADNLYSLYAAQTVTGIMSSGNRAQYGVYSTPTNTANNTGGRTDVMGVYSAPSYLATGDTSGSQENVFGFYSNASAGLNSGTGSINQYGVYIANGSSSTAGTSTKYGINIEGQTGADTNYAIYSNGGQSYFAGNVGIGGDDTPNSALAVGDGTDELQVSSVGDLTFVDANGAASITGPAGGALNITAGSAQALNLDSGTTGAVNIGTGANAKTITVGNATGATALAFNSGTGAQTFTSQDATGTTTTSAFAFIDNALTSGTGMYASSTSLTTGKLAQLSTAASNTFSSGTLLDLRTTSAGLTGFAGTGSLVNLDWSPSSATATGDLFALNIGSGGTTTGNLFNILDSGSSIFNVSERDFTTSLPTNFTAPGDVAIAYDINFTNPTSSFIKSAAPITIQAGESFNSSNLTLKTYNNGAVVIDSALSLNSQKTLTVNSATPSVAGGSHFITANSSGTVYTNFTDGNDGQILVIKINDANTDFDCTSTNLKCGGADLTAGAAGDIFTFIYDGTNWNLINWMDVSATQTGADLAEYYVSDQDLVPGDVVTIDPGQAAKVQKSSSAYDAKSIGIVSTQPGLALANTGDLNTYAIALVGRVPTKVSTENGPIHAGDYITTSSVSGVGMRATKPGQVLGKALEDFSGAGVQKIAVFVNTTFADPGDALANLLVGDNGNLLSSAPTFNKLTITSDIKVGGILSANKIGIDASTLNLVGALASVPVDAANKVSIADAINALNSKSSAVSSQLSTLENKQASDSAVLAATKQAADQAVAQTLSLNDKVASTSSSLNSLASQIDGLLASLGGGSTPATPAASLNLTPPATMIATDSATIANLKVTSDATISGQLLAYGATVQDTFKSLGQTFLGNTTVAGDISQDGTLQITEGSKINALPILYFQDSPLASGADFFNGKVTIAKTGLLSAESLALGTQSLGESAITTGQLEIFIPNISIKADSKVFLTPTTTLQGNLFVSQLVPGSGFKVKVTQANLAQIKFNWLIIQTKEASN